jgi:hypothetical protein
MQCLQHRLKVDETLAKTLETNANIRNIQKTLTACVKHIQHPDKHTYNTRLKNS